MRAGPGNWVKKGRLARVETASEGLSVNERAELERMRRENAELQMQPDVRVSAGGAGTTTSSR